MSGLPGVASSGLAAFISTVRAPLASGGVIFWMIAATLSPSSARPVAAVHLRPPSSLVRGERVWLSPPFRRNIQTTRADELGEVPLTFVNGRRSCFVALGNGWYERRDGSSPLLRGELVVTEGAFVVKSELLR
jgi:hypothetical protein